MSSDLISPYIVVLSHHRMKNLLSLFILCSAIHLSVGQPLTFESIKGYPFPTGLTASAAGSRIAWAVDEKGKRNVYVAEGPGFKARKLTNYNNDDGQEITSLAISPDGKWVVFVRGGEHGSNWDDGVPINPSFAPEPFKVQIISVPFAGGEAKVLAEGDEPVISPKGDVVAFPKGNQVMSVGIDGSVGAKSLFTTRGSVGSLAWSPDGSKLSFVSYRGDHALIGIYSNASAPILWIAPAFTRDESPRWSPDGTALAFIRTNGGGGTPDSILRRKHVPWSIWKADAATGQAVQLWKAPTTLRGSIPTTHGGTNLHWASGDRIAFLSYHDGWPHLYSIHMQGGKETLLTPGNFMAEFISLSPDKKWLVFAANTGGETNDLDRRHIVRVPVDKATMQVMTPGTGLEWSPVLSGDGSNLFFISATAQRPPVPAVLNLTAKKPAQLIGDELIPQGFPMQQLITPKKVTFPSSDGVTVHADLFEPAGGLVKKPAIIYIHGGPPRQMLLGWHYSDYYSNAYAINQYLASLGFIVLSVNYRLGIGYGFEFHQPANAGSSGASEYLDVKAAGEWLAKQLTVDPTKIGVYGGSYGGFLTALALGRDSKLFAAGVDIHGVHDFVVNRNSLSPPPDQYEKAPDLQTAIDVAWKSSPVAYVSNWTSPVLIIHGDDDRNVRFSQSSDLVRRLEKRGVQLETLVIVDDTHHWMRHTNAILVGNATAEFFKRKLMPPPKK
jgi:dipeptidyl aminopeptidase/acylaminoacyl peptidase